MADVRSSGRRCSFELLIGDEPGGWQQRGGGGILIRICYDRMAEDVNDKAERGGGG